MANRHRSTQRQQGIRFKIGSLPFSFSKGSSALAATFFIGLGVGWVAAWQLQPELFVSDQPDRRAYACFSPDGNCEQLILRAIHEAQQAIWIQAYAFTSKPLAQALIRACKRGVRVRVLCDKSQFSSPHSVVATLKASGIEVQPDRVRGLAHNKVMLIDTNRLLIGSYNFTNAANRSNAENLLYIQDPKLHHIYLQNWHRRFKASTQASQK